MQHQLRVDTAGVQAMASGWGASVTELNAIGVPAVRGFSNQASTIAVNLAHADIKGFTEALAAQVTTRATQVAEADTCYIANEASSADRLAAVADPVTEV